MSDMSVEKAVQTVIKAQVVEALSGDQNIVEALVSAALEKRSDSYADRGKTVLEVLVQSSIADAARQGIVDLLKTPEMQQKLRAAAQPLLEAQISALAEQIANNDWKISVSVDKTEY